MTFGPDDVDLLEQARPATVHLGGGRRAVAETLAGRVGAALEDVGDVHILALEAHRVDDLRERVVPRARRTARPRGPRPRREPRRRTSPRRSRCRRRKRRGCAAPGHTGTCRRAAAPGSRAVPGVARPWAWPGPSRARRRRGFPTAGSSRFWLWRRAVRLARRKATHRRFRGVWAWKASGSFLRWGHRPSGATRRLGYHRRGERRTERTRRLQAGHGVGGRAPVTVTGVAAAVQFAQDKIEGVVEAAHGASGSSPKARKSAGSGAQYSRSCPVRGWAKASFQAWSIGRSGGRRPP